MALSSGGFIPSIAPSETRPRVINQAIRQAIDGKLNCVSTFTLASGATQTVVTDRRVGAGSLIALMPLTASANASYTGGEVRVSAQNRFGFTLSHDASGTSDREFRYCVLG